jgi:glycosyltransferase involved in cell wall biosynthesis
MVWQMDWVSSPELSIHSFQGQGGGLNAMKDLNQISSSPLVSIVIPCYNHSNYLPTAIESILKQTYSTTEIIVVDDGSTDNTRQVAQSYPGVKYIYQNNQGLSASRNTGIKNSEGDYLIFLDADDWLYPEAIKINLGYLLQNKAAAFVSGAHDKIFIEKNIVEEKKRDVNSSYVSLLQGNYISMIAAVLFQKWVFDEYMYDITLKSCEDYDLYLKISRKYPIIHHTEKIAAYRIHNTNMSSNIPAMLSCVLSVLRRQKKWIKTEEEKKAFKKGNAVWKKYFCKEMYDKLKNREIRVTAAVIFSLLKYKPRLFLKYLF